MDYVVPQLGAFFNLLARKEGIVLGLGNLRLPRYAGGRPSRQGILFDRQFPADSPDGQLLCDVVVRAAEMDETLVRCVPSLVGSGVVSAGQSQGHASRPGTS